jgi:hypothetical protein
MIQSKIPWIAGFSLLLAGSSLAASPPPPKPSTLTVTTVETTQGLDVRGEASCNADAQTKAWQGWTKGGEYKRAKALDSIRNLRRGANVAQIEAASDCLRRYYGLRASRQQTALDAESSIVFIGALGSLASVKAGATTQAYWSYAAIMPVVVAQFNANEPTRDLYAGGRVGLDVIASRYHRLEVLTGILDDSMHSGGALKTAPYSNPCTQLKAGTGVEDWASGEDKTAMLPDYRKLRQACANAEFMELNLQSLYTAANTWKASYSSAYARDLLRLDDEILNKDRDLRYSPIEALSAMAAAPFTAAATLLSGENGGKALDRLKTQGVFSSLNVPLEPIFLPPPPAPIPEFYTVGDAALARPAAVLAAENAAPKLGAKAAAAAAAVKPRKPTAAETSTMLVKLQDAAKGLNDARGDLNYRLTIANAIASLAAYDRMDFTYDATTARISVVLTTTPPAVTTSPATSR